MTSIHVSVFLTWPGEHGQHLMPSGSSENRTQPEHQEEGQAHSSCGQPSPGQGRWDLCSSLHPRVRGPPEWGLGGPGTCGWGWGPPRGSFPHSHTLATDTLLLGGGPDGVRALMLSRGDPAVPVGAQSVWGKAHRPQSSCAPAPAARQRLGAAPSLAGEPDAAGTAEQAPLGSGCCCWVPGACAVPRAERPARGSRQPEAWGLQHWVGRPCLGMRPPALFKGEHTGGPSLWERATTPATGPSPKDPPHTVCFS